MFYMGSFELNKLRIENSFQGAFLNHKSVPRINVETVKS